MNLIVRPMLSSEKNMVLSDWKRELFDLRHRNEWSRGLRTGDFWMLLNRVLDRITLPTCQVFMGCHKDDPTVPLCWAAVREDDVLMMYARGSVRADAELGYTLQTAFLKLLAPARKIQYEFNPFVELKR